MGLKKFSLFMWHIVQKKILVFGGFIQSRMQNLTNYAENKQFVQFLV